MQTLKRNSPSQRVGIQMAAVRARLESALEASNAAAQRSAAALETAARTEGAQALLVAALETERERVARSVEAVTTTALQTVFGPSVRFRFGVEVQGASVQMRPEIGYAVGASVVWRSPADVGGGVVDVAAFALRVVVLMLAVPARPRVLVLDEPFKHVSDALLPAVCELVKRLAKDLDMQFLIVSHEEAMAEGADRVFHIEKRDNASRVAASAEAEEHD